MKKVKIMLMSVAFLAIVGGSLAFKAKFGGEICTMDIALNPTTAPIDACPEIIATLNAPNQHPVLTADPAFVETYKIGEIVYCTPTECTPITYTTAD